MGVLISVKGNEFYICSHTCQKKGCFGQKLLATKAGICLHKGLRNQKQQKRSVIFLKGIAGAFILHPDFFLRFLTFSKISVHQRKVYFQILNTNRKIKQVRPTVK